MILGRSVPTKIKRLEKQVDDLRATIEAKDREIAVLKAETETMACVISRDRERIKSEGAAYARQRAESETDGRTDQSIQ